MKPPASDLDRKYFGYPAISDTLFEQILIFFQLTLIYIYIYIYIYIMYKNVLIPTHGLNTDHNNTSVDMDYATGVP